MVKTKDLSGIRYGNLVAKYQGEDHVIKSNGQKRPTWVCSCDCGSETTILAASLVSGNSLRCKLCAPQHIRKLTNIYGNFHKPTKNSWCSMVSRCTNPNTSNYATYGAVGVTVCERWLEPSPKGYFNFLEDMGERPEGTTLHRKRGALEYSKETCEWATFTMQSYDRKIDCDNKSGRVGVFWWERINRWMARINVDGKIICLGQFKTIEPAIEARRAGEIKYYGFAKD